MSYQLILPGFEKYFVFSQYLKKICKFGLWTHYVNYYKYSC